LSHYYGGLDAYGNKGTQGIQDNRNLPQNTDAAADAALKEQDGEEIFKSQEAPDAQRLVDRLNEITEEVSVLQAKLWGPPGYYERHEEAYKGPPYLERERLQKKMDALDSESWSIKAQLREILDAAGTGVDESGGGQFKGTATKVIGGET